MRVPTDTLQNTLALVPRDRGGRVRESRSLRRMPARLVQEPRKIEEDEAVFDGGTPSIAT